MAKVYNLYDGAAPQMHHMGTVSVMVGTSHVVGVVRVPSEGYFNTVKIYSHGAVSVQRMADEVARTVHEDTGQVVVMAREPK